MWLRGVDRIKINPLRQYGSQVLFLLNSTTPPTSAEDPSSVTRKAARGRSVIPSFFSGLVDNNVVNPRSEREPPATQLPWPVMQAVSRTSRLNTPEPITSVGKFKSKFAPKPLSGRFKFCPKILAFGVLVGRLNCKPDETGVTLSCSDDCDEVVFEVWGAAKLGAYIMALAIHRPQAIKPLYVKGLIDDICPTSDTFHALSLVKVNTVHMMGVVLFAMVTVAKRVDLRSNMDSVHASTRSG